MKSEIKIYESDCLSGEPRGPLTGRMIEMPEEAVRSLFTPESVADDIIERGTQSIPRNVYQILLDEIEKRGLLNEG